MKNLRKLLAPILFWHLAAMLACSPGKVFKGGVNESKPKPIQALNRASSANLQEELQPIMTARYNANISAIKSKYENMCQGIVTVTIYSNFKMKPEGKIRCDIGGMEIDASELAKDFNIPTEQLDPKAHPQAGYIVRKPNPQQGQPGPRFTPNYPSTLGPIVQDVTKYEGFQYGEKTTISGTAIESGQPLQDVGAWQITVLEAGTTYTSEENPDLVYDNIIHWRMQTFGFGLAPKRDTGVFDLTEYWFNARPIAIPKIVMQAELKDMIPPGQVPELLATLGQAFIGTIRITLVIMDESRL